MQVSCYLDIIHPSFPSFPLFPPPSLLSSPFLLILPSFFLSFSRSPFLPSHPHLTPLRATSLQFNAHSLTSPHLHSLHKPFEAPLTHFLPSSAFPEPIHSGGLLRCPSHCLRLDVSILGSSHFEAPHITLLIFLSLPRAFQRWAGRVRCPFRCWPI